MPVVCVSLESQVCWLIPGDTLAVIKSGKVNIYHGAHAKWAEYRIKFSDIPKKLCSGIQHNMYIMKHAEQWDVPTSLQHQIEREAFSKIKPFLQYCGVSVSRPAVQNTPVDHLWSCEWIDGLRVQQKMSRPVANQSGYLVDSRRKTGSEQAGKQNVPYTQDEIDMFWVAPPSRHGEEHLHHTSFFSDSFLLAEKGVLSVPSRKITGKVSMYIYYTGAPDNRRKTYGWTKDCLINTSADNWATAAERLTGIIQKFAVRSGRSKK
eukprot:GDKI01035443.1.p1 GENE.GDKI01035443.1~~GDKI01035443.1.p1  ORF type:complete len:263 (-),score=40.70 GDKI01035443.1:312-1100(-)